MMNSTVSTTASERRHSVGREGSPRRSKSTAKSADKSLPSYFNRTLINEREAAYLWRRCSELVEASNAAGHIAFQCIKVHGIDAELSVLVGRRGSPGHFWLRVMYSNELVLTGNRHGLLPMDESARPRLIGAGLPLNFPSFTKP